MYARMGDAAFARNIGPGFDIAGGYYGGPNAYHVWPHPDWTLFPGNRLPIWVAGMNGEEEGRAAVDALRSLGVPPGSLTAVDMEARRDETYLTAFGAILGGAGYKTWVYGSEAFVYANPPLNGYWVAAYGLTMVQVDAILQSAPHVRAVQYAPNIAPGYDASLVKPWTEGEMWHG